MKSKVWKRLVFVPSYLIMEISDSGMEEIYEGRKPVCVEKDDLRISLILSAGMEIVMDGGRLVATEDGMWIETLVDIK